MAFAKGGCAPLMCKRAEDQGLFEPLLTIRGEKLRTFSSLSCFLRSFIHFIHSHESLLKLLMSYMHGAMLLQLQFIFHILVVYFRVIRCNCHIITCNLGCRDEDHCVAVGSHKTRGCYDLMCMYPRRNSNPRFKLLKAGEDNTPYNTLIGLCSEKMEYISFSPMTKAPISTAY